MIRSLVIALVFAFGCKDKPKTPPPSPAAKTSHPAMPNQMEVGSTIGGRYRITKKLGDAGDYQVFAVEHVDLEKAFTLVTPLPGRGSDGMRAMKFELADAGATPDGTAYAVFTLTDDQVRDLLAGKL